MSLVKPVPECSNLYKELARPSEGRIVVLAGAVLINGDSVRCAIEMMTLSSIGIGVHIEISGDQAAACRRAD